MKLTPKHIPHSALCNRKKSVFGLAKKADEKVECLSDGN